MYSKILNFSTHYLFTIYLISQNEVIEAFTTHLNQVFLRVSTSILWNVARQILNIPDTAMPVSMIKNKLKKFLTDKQTLGDDINWIEHNYDPF